MKLYGSAPTRALRVLWLLGELDLDCEIIPVNILKGENRSPSFLAINPAAKLPVLVDGDLVLTESSAIPIYLAEKYSDGRLIPGTYEHRAQMYRWIFFLTTEIEQPLWRIALHTNIYEEGERSESEKKLAARDGKRMISVLEEYMRGREFFAGDNLSVADFNAAYTLDWAHEARMLEDAPRLQKFVTTMYARPNAPPTIAEGIAAMKHN